MFVQLGCPFGYSAFLVGQIEYVGFSMPGTHMDVRYQAPVRSQRLGMCSNRGCFSYLKYCIFEQYFVVVSSA